MNDEHKPGDNPQNESDPVVLLKKIQQHLVYLEKKIDTLIAQPQSQGQAPVSFKRNFSRPPRPFGHPHGAGRGKHPHRPGAAGQSPFQGRSSEGRSGNDRPSFNKSRGSNENRGFFAKKKPFFRHGKG